MTILKVKKNWKKIALGIFTGLIILTVVVIISFFLWIKTWKTYTFSGGQMSIKYPSTWTLTTPRDEKFDSVEIKNREVTLISIPRYYPEDSTLAKSRIEGVVARLGANFDNEFYIDGEKAYSATINWSGIDTEKIQYIGVSHKNYVYEFHLYYFQKGISHLWEKFIYNIILRLVRFH